MKKLFACTLALAMLLSLAACGGSNQGGATETPAATPAVETPAAEAPAETPAETPAEEDEENYDTGDASLDDPRNQDGIGETELLVGFVPRFHSGKAHTSFTLKQRYVPWHCPLSRHRWVLEPLTVGLFFNTISGDDFWANQPDRYPKKYYGFSTKVRSHIYLGQRLRFNIPTRHRRSHKAVSFYYEISSCDLYIVSKATNKEFPWSETLSLALGLRWEM